MQHESGKNRFFKTLMDKIPQNDLSRLMGSFAQTGFSRHFISCFVKKYNVDLSECRRKTGQFESLDDFFTRRLKSGARPVDARPGSVVSPADGRLLSIGKIDRGTAVQAKGHVYSIPDLLGSREFEQTFHEGWFYTVYLSPSDYHRIHSPVAGKVKKCLYCPGRLYPVVPVFTETRPGIFTGNERISTIIENDEFTCAVASIGAMNVGSISLDFDSSVRTNARKKREPFVRYYNGVSLEKGGGLGAFHLGSSVVVLVNRTDLKPAGVGKGRKIKTGQAVLI